MAVVGDFNVAPDDRDVWDPKAFAGMTHVTTQERKAISDLVDIGLVDVFREKFDQPGLFSWWDYRGGSFYKKQGMRIDLVLASSVLAESLEFTVVDRNERKGEKPSDHAPVIADFEMT